MARQYAMIYEENEESLRIPADAHTFEGFCRWVESDEFPESGRIDFLEGRIAAALRPASSGRRGLVPLPGSRTWRYVLEHRDA